MPPPEALEISSFRERHPLFGEALLSRYTPPLIYRLSIDPAPPEAVGTAREVQIELLRRPGDGDPESLSRSICWAGTSELAGQALLIGPCIPPQDATEDAAIGAMALLVSNLEGGQIRAVLPIGTSADYLLEWVNSGEEVRVEVSGLRAPRWASESSGRLAEKTSQILSGNRSGYVSVSTFGYPPDGTVHSFLHFVRRRPGPKPKKRGKMKGRGTTMPVKSDNNSRATLASLEGGAALARGDTVIARRMHGEAGELLSARAQAALKTPDRHLYWLLAATQFFKGGDYRRALRVASWIEAKFLDPKHRDVLSAFLKQVRERSAPGYARTIREELSKLWHAGRVEEVLNTLREHPYVMDPDCLAFIRAVLCERLKDYPAAAALFGLAYRFRPHVTYATMAAGYLFQLTGEGQFADAIRYGQLLAKSLPHPVVSAAVSVVFLQKARLRAEAEREPIFKEQLRWFEASRTGYQDLLKVERANHDVRDLMVLAYDAAAMAHLQLGDEGAAAALSDEARATWPDAGHLWTVRGLAAASVEEGVSYFRRAAELGDVSYTPYYFLAQDAYAQGDFQTALKWAREALARSTQGQAGRARLHGFVAGCIDLSGGDRDEADTLFRRAIELDPRDAGLKEAYEIFRKTPRTVPPPRQARVWRERAGELYDYQVPARLRNAADREVGRVLQTAGAR
jgi:hypothetical protein